MLNPSLFMTPLHLAVIQNDIDAVSKYQNSVEYAHACDALGFTPLELARFLGHRRCEILLNPSQPQKIKVQKAGESEPITYSIDEFEKEFHVIYRPFLKFSSYAQLKEVIKNCPYLLRSSKIAADNYAYAEKFHFQIANGMTAKVVIKWIDQDLGYGLFADESFPEGAFVGEYTGNVRRLFRNRPDQNGYCFHYPTRFWSLKYFTIDALKEGNVLRFINHSDTPNLRPLCAVDRNLLHLIFVTTTAVTKGTQLTFDYGNDYWMHRRKIKMKHEIYQ